VAGGPVVIRVLREFLTCGLVEHGLARAWCSTCRKSYLVRYSCRGRSFCPSCEKKRSLLWAEWLREEVLEAVPHRHVVVTIPRLLRPLFRRRRELLREGAQSGAEALCAFVGEHLAEDVRPGVVVSIATSGDLLQWPPHLHVLVSDGGFSADGVFRPLQVWDGQEIMRLFRARLLARLVERHAISHELATRLLGWRHPGFSAHVGEPIAAGDTHSLEDMAGYVVRNPLSLKRLVYLDGQQAVIYRALKPNPSLGQNFLAMDPLEWLARMTDHIPDPRRHRTLFYGRYANRARGARQKEKALLETAQAEVPKRRRCTRRPSAASSTTWVSRRPRANGRHPACATCPWTTRAGRRPRPPGSPTLPERAGARLTALPGRRGFAPQETKRDSQATPRQSRWHGAGVGGAGWRSGRTPAPPRHSPPRARAKAMAYS
jgi:hypothetical protein